MKPFRYALDPVCVAGAGLYLLNSFWLRKHVGGAFLRHHFNDALFIPAALPIVLWLQRRCRLRPDDAFPRWSEILLHFAVWSFTAEWIVPRVVAHATGDWRDVVAYAAGGIVAGGWWHWQSRS